MNDEVKYQICKSYIEDKIHFDDMITDWNTDFKAHQKYPL